MKTLHTSACVGGAVCERSRPARVSISCSTAQVCPSSGQVSGRSGAQMVGIVRASDDSCNHAPQRRNLPLALALLCLLAPGPGFLHPDAGCLLGGVRHLPPLTNWRRRRGCRWARIKLRKGLEDVDPTAARPPRDRPENDPKTSPLYRFVPGCPDGNGMGPEPRLVRQAVRLQMDVARQNWRAISNWYQSRRELATHTLEDVLARVLGQPRRDEGPVSHRLFASQRCIIRDYENL